MSDMENLRDIWLKGTEALKNFCFFFYKGIRSRTGRFHMCLSVLEGLLIILPPYNWKDFKSLAIPRVDKDAVGQVFLYTSDNTITQWSNLSGRQIWHFPINIHVIFQLSNLILYTFRSEPSSRIFCNDRSILCL